LTYNDPMDNPTAPSDFRVFNRTTSANQQNLTYGYDPVGNLLSIADTLFTASRTFSYDALNRLTNASGTFGTNQSQQNCTYVYSPIGNIDNKCGVNFTYATPSGLRPSAVTSTDGPNGKTYTYDANGNMLTRGTQTLTWDIDNRVTSVSILGGGITSMQYDYTGMRVKKDAPTGVTLFPFKGYEIAPDGTITKFIRIGTETFASKKRTSGGATTQFFYHNDHLGGVNVITDINGAEAQRNEYDPWGAVSKSIGNIDQTHRFTGQELDPESGLYYYSGRYYDQEISRFISPDPYIQAPDDPQNLNRYSYVLNNPQGYVDPTGYEGENPGGYYPFWAWYAFFSQLFSSDPEPKYRIKPRKRGAATPQYEVEVKNGGPEDQRLKNVRVYESQPPPWSKDPDWATGNAGNDYPGGGFGGLRLALVQALGSDRPANDGTPWWRKWTPKVPVNLNVIVPVLGGLGPAVTFTYLPQTNNLCVAGGLGASVGRTVSAGPLVLGDLANAKSITEGLSVSYGYQRTELLGAQATGNSSGILGGPTIGVPGHSVTLTYGKCF
jgi:RHS repeat-associated protein